MHDLSDRYYRDSGAVPFIGTAVMLGCGIAAAVGLSLAYGFIAYWNPFIYLTFLATLVFGVGTGMAVTFGAVLGKVRNPLYARLVGVFTGCVAVYLCWAWYMWAVQLDLAGAGQAQLSFEASRMWSMMEFIAANGLWSIFGWTPTGGALYALWLVEAAIIAGATVVLAGGSESPFCEQCGEWTDDAENILALENTDTEQLQSDLEAERYERLDQLCTGAHDEADCLRLTLHTCPKCDESNYLTIKQVKVTLDSDGDPQTAETDVVKRLSIPHEVVEHLVVVAQNPPQPLSQEEVEGVNEVEEGGARAGG